MIEEIRSILYQALEEGWKAEELSKLLTYSLDEAINDFQKDQEEEEKEKLMEKIEAVIDKGILEEGWSPNFIAAMAVLRLIGNPANRSLKEIKHFIRWEGLEI